MKRLLNIQNNGTQKHHSHSVSRTKRQEKAVKQLHDVVIKSNPFTVGERDEFAVGEGVDDTEQKLFNLTTKMIMSETVQRDILDMEERGTRCFTEFCLTTNLG